MLWRRHSLPSPIPPTPLRDAGMESAVSASSKALTSGCHLEMNPPPPSQECWMIGRASSGSSLPPPPPPCRLQKWRSLLHSHLVCHQICWFQTDLKSYYFVPSAPLCTLGGCCSQNNLTLTIPLKPIGREWKVGSVWSNPFIILFSLLLSGKCV